jgi:hypothetical protein
VIREPAVPAQPGGPAVRLDGATGELEVLNTEAGEHRPFVPLADGQPVLRKAALAEAQYRGGVLGVTYFYPPARGKLVLRLFQVPSGAAVGEYEQVGHNKGFALSSNGRLVARLVSDGQVEVSEIASGPLLRTLKGKTHSQLDLWLGPGWLSVQVGKHTHLVRWAEGPLWIHSAHRHRNRASNRIFAGFSGPEGVRATPAGLPRALRYDPKRFVAAARCELIAAADAFGQVVVLDLEGGLVCMFFVFRDQVAAWLPDGTRHGPAGITGGPPTPGALDRIGQALRQAALCDTEPLP